jgi:hypothetical protein
MLHKNAVEPTALGLLEKICRLPELAGFALGGGTNIALRKGHRLSIDLDFFTNKPFDTAAVYKIITGSFKNTELLFEQNQTMMFIIDGVKVDFVLYPFEWSQPFEITGDARLISPEDIIPMKLQAISNRFSKKDFWDIEILLETYPLTRMIGLFKLKFPPVDTGYIVHSLTNFENAGTEADPICLIAKSWETVKQNIREKVMEYTRQFL